MNALRPISYYDERAETVDLTEITSSDKNADILRMLRDNDPKMEWLSICRHDYDSVFGLVYYFFVQEGDDLGWLGYLIGRNTTLRNLLIDNMPEYSEQITALFKGIEKSKFIQHLYIWMDHVGEAVLNSLSALLRSESCSLTSLNLFRMSFSDDMAVALADALKGNKSLKRLRFNVDTAGITSVGWSAFSKLLCDTSSVNNTNLSNHSLERLGNLRNEGATDDVRQQAPQDVKQLLAFNILTLTDNHAAIQKILKFHPDFDVEPFFEWNLKALPLVLSWFERARGMSVKSEEDIQKRQLSTMYNFVRGMPDETIGGYRSYSSHKKEKFDILGRNFTVMCTLVLLCLLNLRLPTWGDFVASSLTLCVCLLQVVSLLVKE
jgi:hypothetical protein